MKKVLIVGNGISGLSTALTLLQNGASVTIVSPYVSERSQSVMAAGGINSVLDTSQGDSIEAHVTDTLKGGCFMEDKSAIESLCADAPDIIKYLEDIGIIFSRNPDGSVAQRAFGGQSYNRTSYSGASTGKQIVTALSRAFRSYAAEGLAQVLLNHYFHSALIADGRCFGILAYNSKDDSLIPLYADAVVMATGGQNQLFGKTTGTTSCDGYATGKLFEQGVTLRNLEFIQYHPTTIETPAKRMLITEAARGEGGRLFYLDGPTRVYFMEDKYGPAGNLMPRDIVAKGIYDAPSQVYLDIAFLGEKLIKERLPEVYDLCMEYINLDVTKEPIPVYPSVHFFMGGIRVNNSHRSNIEALYAVGECASKYHGANRLGGNSLLAACHSGRAAAFDILDRLSSLPIPDFSDYIQSETNIFNKAKESKSSFPADMILKEIATIMNTSLGITRNEAKLREGIESVEFYESKLNVLRFDKDVSLYMSYRLKPMALLAKAILMAADNRKESRGAHIREDFPDKDDSLAKPTMVCYKDGEILISIEDENYDS